MNDEADLYRAFDSDPAPVIDFLRRLVSVHPIPGPPRVLDVGCGPGRLFLPLSQLGWHVVGMEPNEAFFNRAQTVAEPLRHVEVRRGGFNDISAVASFDLILGINSAFAHVATPRERADAFARAFHALRPGGLLVLDLPNLLRILRQWAGPFEHKSILDERPVTLTRHHEVDDHRAMFTTFEEYIYTDEAGREVRFHKEHPYAITSFPELEYLLREAGFDEIRTFGSYAAREVEPVGPGRMIIAAGKPELRKARRGKRISRSV
jgi:SAM-dependent methyltransferase